MEKEPPVSQRDKWRLRARKANEGGVLDVANATVGDISFEQTKRWQKEFQEEYCRTCEEFDPDRGDFAEKGHPADPANCRHHWTDSAGQCFNFRKRRFYVWLDERISLLPRLCLACTG